MQTIEDKVKELNTRKQAVQEASDFIKERKKEYEKDIRIPTAFIEREEREIRVLLDSKVSVSLKTYVEELAKLWNTKVRNLEATLIVDTFNGELSMEQMLKELLSKSWISSYPRYSFSFLVDYKDGSVTHSACISQPITGEFLQAKQKDGKTFISHLRAEIIKLDEDHYESSIVCDDFSPLMFDFNFCYMLNIMENDTEQEKVALLNAAIRDDQQFEGMTNSKQPNC